MTGVTKPAGVGEFERDGISFASALDYCPELLVMEGLLTRRAPTSRERQDIEFGWQLAKEMGRLDVGQSVAVKESAALAVEAIEKSADTVEFDRTQIDELLKVAKTSLGSKMYVATILTQCLESLGQVCAHRDRRGAERRRLGSPRRRL